MRTISYGKSYAVAMGHDESAWARNRRVQFTAVPPGAHGEQPGR